MNQVVGRLAPSPTGVLHLGNARSFLLAWLSVRSRQGKLLMRIEDLDGPRVKVGAEQACLFDLEWLGLDWDGAIVRQSERQDLYSSALNQLLEQNRAYPCICSRKEVERAASAPHVGEEGPVYPGTCWKQTVDPNRDPAFRFRTTPGLTSFDDQHMGQVTTDVQQGLGDFVIYKRDGQAAYQLAVVVDDAAMGITEVLRGADLLTSAARQIQLADALGLLSSTYCHVPLVIGADGRRLAKRHGDTSLRAFREAGVSAEEIVGWLAWSCGLQDSAAPREAATLLQDFDMRQLPKAEVVWGESLNAKMKWREEVPQSHKTPRTDDHKRS